jgi:hypothetical protein
MATLDKSLNIDLATLAQILKSKGRGKDTILAHINPKEAALLKRRGGRGSINPNTGLPEFDDGEDVSPEPVEQAPVEQAPAPVEQAPAQVDQIQAPVSDTSFSPTSYSGGFGSSDATPYQGEAGVATPTYAQGFPTQAPTFGGAGGATIDPNAPGPVTQLEPTSTTAPTTSTTGDQTPKTGSMSDFLKGLGISGTDALKGALGAGLGLYGASQARKSASQIAAAQGQEQAIAQPYQTQGQNLVAQAQAGQLSPASQQAFQAAKVQINQQVANRGGVGTQQAANQIANIYQTLLNNQYTYGLNVMQIGDNIALGAIKTGLQLDTQLNQATTNFYSQLAQMVGGGGNIGTNK